MLLRNKSEITNKEETNKSPNTIPRQLSRWDEAKNGQNQYFRLRHTMCDYHKVRTCKFNTE